MRTSKIHSARRRNIPLILALSWEKALLEYVMRMDQRGYPLPVKFLVSLAHMIKRQRSSAFQILRADDGTRLPSKNWPQGFHRHHPQLEAEKVRPLDWARYDIYDKVVEWFTMTSKELSDPAIVLDNVYNMDDTGVLLSVLGSLKVLVSKQNLRNYRGAGVKRTLVTAIECISTDGRCLAPLIIWPAATHRSTWTTHPTPGWHFACSKNAYTHTAISLYWIKPVFDPQTKARVNHKPRLLISDGFGTHESPEYLKFAFETTSPFFDWRLIPPILHSHATLVVLDLSKRHIVNKLSACSVEVQI